MPGTRPSKPARSVVLAALETALRAPSVHNSQPWRWTVTDEHVDLFADEHRRLIATDPEGRDRLLGCGAALHHLRVALAAHGWATTVERFPDPEARRHLARLHPRRDADEPTAFTRDLNSAITRRHTDRRRFSPTPVTDEVLTRLQDIAREHGADLQVVTGAARRTLADAIVDSAELQQQRPGYAGELQRWTSRYAGARDGVPASTVPRSFGLYRDVAMRWFPRSNLGQPRGSVDHEDGTVLLVLATIHDDPVAVLRAGEATSAVLLLATHLGLATTPLSQPLEVGATRTRIRTRVVKNSLEPQLVLRVGWAPPQAEPLTSTPRRALHRILLQAPGARTDDRGVDRLGADPELGG